MDNNEPHDHHYVPQFYLRSFATDDAQLKVTTVAKHGEMAIWAERSIENIGYERDFYVHQEGGVPVSVETAINRHMETPISRSETWSKVMEGRGDLLDHFDRPVLYALVRHLEARTPHYLETMRELAEMAADPNSEIPFTDYERRRYAELRNTPGLDRETLNVMATSTKWDAAEFRGAMIMVIRSPIPLRTSTTPVMTLRVPEHAAISLPLPGMVPFQRVLPLNPSTLVSITDGSFGGAFHNLEVPEEVAMGFNRHRATQFSHFPHVRHMIASRDGLVADMTWAPYDLIAGTDRKITFRRRASDR